MSPNSGFRRPTSAGPCNGAMLLRAAAQTGRGAHSPVAYCSIDIQPLPAGSNVRKSAVALRSSMRAGAGASSASLMACSPAMYSARNSRGFSVATPGIHRCKLGIFHGMRPLAVWRQERKVNCATPWRIHGRGRLTRPTVDQLCVHIGQKLVDPVLLDVGGGVLLMLHAWLCHSAVG